ncbi:hypothetical protein AGMMS50262_04740 [Bacteroidia bacterium]|nr:hypothetical protein AGMMS50262_04740 [Bacteroidia bacterium]
MTQITIKQDINSTQMSILLHLFSTWNVKAEIAEENFSKEKKTEKKLFSNLRGIWKDRDIDAKKLRQEAWAIDRYAQK